MSSDIPVDFLKNLELYKPRQYSSRQLALLSSQAKFAYIEKITTYNRWCDEIGLPERRVAVKED